MALQTQPLSLHSVAIDLTTPMRLYLRDLLQGRTRLPGWTLHRWATVQLGGAFTLSTLELEDLANLFDAEGIDLVPMLRMVERL